MTDPGALLVHRVLSALHLGDAAALARRLHPDVTYDTGRKLLSGRDAVAAALIAPRYEHLEAEIVPGRVEGHGDRLTAQTSIVLRWRGSGEPADVSHQAHAIEIRDGLIARLELLTPPVAVPLRVDAPGDSKSSG